jgi:hypothetical protein
MLKLICVSLRIPNTPDDLVMFMYVCDVLQYNSR